MKRLIAAICKFALPLIISSSDSTGASTLLTSEESKMNSICDLPEKVSAFKAFIESRVGRKISDKSIDLLKRDLEITVDESKIDPYFSRTEKARLVALSKQCIAGDSVPYELKLVVIIDSTGSPVFSQAYLIYRIEDILNGKREFAFENVFGSKADYEALISKNTVGLMNRKELIEYMTSIGCSIVETERSDNTLVFLYRIRPEEDLASRLAGWDFSKKIHIGFDSEGVVTEVSVREYLFE